MGVEGRESAPVSPNPLHPWRGRHPGERAVGLEAFLDALPSSQTAAQAETVPGATASRVGPLGAPSGGRQLGSHEVSGNGQDPVGTSVSSSTTIMRHLMVGLAPKQNSPRGTLSLLDPGISLGFSFPSGVRSGSGSLPFLFGDGRG